MTKNEKIETILAALPFLIEEKLREHSAERPRRLTPGGRTSDRRDASTGPDRSISPRGQS